MRIVTVPVVAIVAILIIATLTILAVQGGSWPTRASPVRVEVVVPAPIRVEVSSSIYTLTLPVALPRTGRVPYP